MVAAAGSEIGEGRRRSGLRCGMEVEGSGGGEVLTRAAKMRKCGGAEEGGRV
jgi:hypothetical protein